MITDLPPIQASTNRIYVRPTRLVNLESSLISHDRSAYGISFDKRGSRREDSRYTRTLNDSMEWQPFTSIAQQGC